MKKNKNKNKKSNKKKNKEIENVYIPPEIEVDEEKRDVDANDK